MTVTETLWLDEMLDPGARADLEKHVAEAADKDKTLRQLVLATPILRSAIVRAVNACLHIDPLELLADGWRTARDIKAYRNADKATPDTPVILCLAPHSIERDMKPVITVNLAGDKRFALDAGLGLTGAFEGVELMISQGNLVSVSAGKCSLSLQIKTAARTVVSQELKAFRLPGEYRFAQPLALY